jgi:hypothetical protein
MFSHPFLFDCFYRQAICHAEEVMWSTMLEQMQTAFQHSRWEAVSSLDYCLEQVCQVFSRMRKIQDAHGITPMQIEERLQPIGSIGHRTDSASPG